MRRRQNQPRKTRRGMPGIEHGAAMDRPPHSNRHGRLNRRQSHRGRFAYQPSAPEGYFKPFHGHKAKGNVETWNRMNIISNETGSDPSTASTDARWRESLQKATSATQPAATPTANCHLPSVIHAAMMNAELTPPIFRRTLAAWQRNLPLGWSQSRCDRHCLAARGNPPPKTSLAHRMGEGSRVRE